MPLHSAAVSEELFTITKAVFFLSKMFAISPSSKKIASDPHSGNKCKIKYNFPSEHYIYANLMK